MVTFLIVSLHIIQMDEITSRDQTVTMKLGILTWQSMGHSWPLELLLEALPLIYFFFVFQTVWWTKVPLPSQESCFFLKSIYSIIVRGEEELGFGWLHLMRWDLTVRSQRNHIYFNVSLTDLLSIHLLKTFREDLNSQVIFITLFWGLAMKEN